jgi:hypothetical protein
VRASDRTDRVRFFQEIDNVALLVPAGELFGLMTRSVDLPAAWAALVTTEAGGKSVVTAGGLVEAGGDDLEDVLFFRVTPVEIGFDHKGFPAADGFRCRADVTLHVRIVPDRSEVASFRNSVLGSRAAVRAADLAAYLAPAVQKATLAEAEKHDAIELVEGDHDEAVTAALSDALREVFFTCGLSLDRSPQVRFESEAARRIQARREDSARRQAEHEAAREMRVALEAAQRAHVDHLSDLLARLSDLARQSPDVELPELLKSFSEQQRGELYGALFAAKDEPAVTQWIVVAAGDALLFYEPSDLETPKRRLTISGAAGAVRSIQTDAAGSGLPVLLLGAAAGVYHLPIDRTEPDATFLVSDCPSVRGGFNAAVICDGYLYATHSELGLRVWPLESQNRDRALFASLTRAASAVRHVYTHGGELFCSVDDRVIRWRGADAKEPDRIYTGSADTITSLVVTSDGIFAGNSRGDVLLWSHGLEGHPELLHRGPNRAAESVWPLSGGGIKRLVFTDTSLQVHARVLDDSFVCAYEAGGQTLRRVEVAPDLIAATTDVRDRVICWSPGAPATPRGTIPVSRLTGRTVQDVCLVPYRAADA